MNEHLDEPVGNGVPNSPPVGSALASAERKVDMTRAQTRAKGPLDTAAVGRERDVILERVAVDDGPGRGRGGGAGHDV
jgi:hypothetical protein